MNMHKSPLHNKSTERMQDDAHLSFGFARRHKILYIPAENRVYYRQGVSIKSLAEARRFLHKSFDLEEVDAGRFDELLQNEYERGSDSMQAMDELDSDMDLKDVARQLAEPEDLMESQDDAPIIRLINALLTSAVRENASDIHIESFETSMVVRFRVDGVLREVLRPQRKIAPLLISRIKVMAKLDIAEKRLPQDGRISLKIAGRAVDVRVSTLPSGNGERVVMRLLDRQGGRLELESLGMDSDTLKSLLKLIHQSHGIVLITGPTGSGKTTTIYAALTCLNNTRRNILTVEDPIEYYLEGIGQTQVNTKIEMTFARGLRAILRQDPDVVMVGEIRDIETAQIAIQASLTGHMVLSTLHTNTAVGSVTRLRDMGVEPFLLSSGLLGVVSQRLVRLLCPACKQAHTATISECECMGIPVDIPPTIYNPGPGCEQCNLMSYRGRTGIYELITIDDAMRKMIHDDGSEQDLETYARKHSKGILDDGFRRVIDGVTSLEEVLRVNNE